MMSTEHVHIRSAFTFVFPAAAGLALPGCPCICDSHSFRALVILRAAHVDRRATHNAAAESGNTDVL